jgi:hypothetical protein
MTTPEKKYTSDGLTEIINWQAPACPYCGGKNVACDEVENGVAMIQCGPYRCDDCHAYQIGPNDDESQLTQEEKITRWYAPYPDLRRAAATPNRRSDTSYVDCSPGPEPTPDPTATPGRADDPTADDRPRGWPGLRCPECGEENSCRLQLHDMGVYCVECDENFTAADAAAKLREAADKWASIAAWVRKAAVIEG